MTKYTDFDIPVTIAGVKFRNPFYVSSGPTTMTVEQIERIQETGWAGASLKLTVDPLPYINRHPRYGYYPEKGFLTFTAERRLTLEELLKLIADGRKRAPRIVLMSNITYSGDQGPEGWANMAARCEAAGVHINELNMCCPNMSFNVELTGRQKGGPKTGASMGKDMETVFRIVEAVRKATKVPLFVKITPEGGAQARIAKAALEAGADAVGGNANRLGVPPINIFEPTRSQYFLQEEVGMACMNGEWLRPLALRDVYEMRKLCGPDAALTATGGVAEWRDAVEMMMCGADLVGICTATLVKGFGFMPEFIHGFKEFMKAKGYRQPRDMRDILVPAITSAPDLTIYAGHARKKQTGLVAPCTFACPNSVPAMGYVRKVAEEEFEEAFQLILSRSPLQSICGKICDHPCEEACTRGLMDEPIMIRGIKHFVLEMGRREGWQPKILSARAKARGKKVAVIGSGPSGLACAYDLARAGYAVTVFEADQRLGGMLTSCIPAFRLAAADVTREIETIRSLGVQFRTGQALGRDLSLQGLRKSGFEAVFLGVGAQTGQTLGIPGEHLRGCLNAVDFLRSVSEGDLKKMTGRVAVVGGGFTAVDAARTALRLGAEEVFILYRRTRDEMPAAGDEVREAEEEGVKIMYLVAPQEVLGGAVRGEGVSPLRPEGVPPVCTAGILPARGEGVPPSAASSSVASSSSSEARVTAIRMLNYVLGEADPGGRRKPVEVPGTEFTLAVDTVIAAVSQGVSVSAGQDLALSRWGSIVADEATGATNVAGVYAGGDCVRGPADVIQAVADGKRAAVSIDRFLSGDSALLVYDAEKVESDKDMVLQRTGNRPRQKRPQLGAAPGAMPGAMPLRVLAEGHGSASTCLSPQTGKGMAPGGAIEVASGAAPGDAAQRARTFAEYAPTLTPEQAVAEAQRCLACGCGVGCETCSDICKMFAWSIDAQGRAVLDEDKCVACGMCVWRCPNKNIEMVQTGTTNLTK